MYKTYIIVRNSKDISTAMKNQYCNHIVYECNGNIYIYDWVNGAWVKRVFTLYGKLKERDNTVSGYKAYCEFYKSTTREALDEMKAYYEPIDPWDAVDQCHYYNTEYASKPLYMPIFELDINSAFTYGAIGLPSVFEPLKTYLLAQYERKEKATTDVERSKYKNKQVYLIGYFARIKQLAAVRSEIIHLSNRQVYKYMAKVNAAGGTVFLSNTDSIVTDCTGYNVLKEYVGTKCGQLKVAGTYDRLFYRSSNCYQLGNKVVYSGVKYFAQKHTDLFLNQSAVQSGHLVDGFDFDFEADDDDAKKLCRVRNGTITVKVYNSQNELIDIIEYRGNVEYE